MMKQVQKGFTLIELMIVVAIIGILAAIAIPAYQDYTIRSQASEGLAMASAAKASISEYYADKGVFPADATALGWVDASGAVQLPSGKYVDNIDVLDGVITITYGGLANPAIDTATATLTPGYTTNGDIVWVCQDGTSPTNATFDTTPTAGSILSKYMPSTCRP
jgi:type IV pilus assembly protein PilA